MDNQHTKIKGYRDLSQAEIDLMNRIKTAGAALLDLHAEVVESLVEQRVRIEREAASENVGARLADHIAAEPQRWAAIAKTDIQTGLMALIRSVAQPTI